MKTRMFKFLGIPVMLLMLAFTANQSYAQADPYLAFAEKMPQPVGGLKAVYKNIEYPDIAKRAGIEGKVFVLAYIDETGKVGEVKVVKGIGGGCDEAAVEGVKKAKFEPGQNQGTKVKVKLSLTINFKLG